MTRATGHSVVLLHSSGLSGRQWKRLASELSERGLHVSVPDLAGHGTSEPWPAGTPVAFGVLEADDADARATLLEEDPSWGPDTEDERWLQTFVEYWGGQGAWLALRPEVRAEFVRVAWVVREGVRSLMEDKTPARAYSAFTFPTELVTGGRSPIAARRVIQRLGEAIPSARIVTIPNAGHLAPVTHPNLVNPVLLAAIDRALSR